VILTAENIFPDNIAIFCYSFGESDLEAIESMVNS
jgi:hypothetical protein